MFKGTKTEPEKITQLRVGRILIDSRKVPVYDESDPPVEIGTELKATVDFQMEDIKAVELTPTEITQAKGFFLNVFSRVPGISNIEEV